MSKGIKEVRLINYKAGMGSATPRQDTYVKLFFIYIFSNYNYIQNIEYIYADYDTKSAK